MQRRDEEIPIEFELREDLDRLIARSSQDCIKLMDVDARLLYINPAGQALLAIADITAVLGRCWLDFWEGADRAAARLAVEKAKHGNEGSFQGYFATLAGEPKWWDVRVTPMWDRQGSIRYVLSISRDITELHRAIEDLERTRAVLLDKVRELEDFEKVVIGRELKMMALEKEIEDLRAEPAERRRPDRILPH